MSLDPKSAVRKLYVNTPWCSKYGDTDSGRRNKPLDSPINQVFGIAEIDENVPDELIKDDFILRTFFPLRWIPYHDKHAELWCTNEMDKAKFYLFIEYLTKSGFEVDRTKFEFGCLEDLDPRYDQTASYYPSYIYECKSR
ncbi:hypothetical protein QCA50_012381 [Cerrena zonata]|uniref:Uncharacterized protein n=1 Tax=Cerrena zonata TaxID=2478898 RepID=A0AAW0FYD0_9APHY